MDFGDAASADACSETPGAADRAGDAHDRLLRAACAGDRAAQQHLCSDSLPALRRWARRGLRGIDGGTNDADDLVQSALLRALVRIRHFEVRGSGGFLAYLRQILLNEIRNERRRRRRHGEMVELDESAAIAGDPVFEHALGRERNEVCTSALQRLSRCQREHIALRFECGMSFGEIAAHTGNSEDGARMRVARALRAMARYVAPAAA
jgi:RNA polymerase sigma-70 factor (ECF subfamily)